jgi:2-oxoglutarate dehydrogenase E1 component
VDHTNGHEWAPLAHLDADQGKFWIYDSLLSEYAGLGFEYGYSVANTEALVCWEAQFGDFVNGASPILDQYLVAAEDKWDQVSGLVLLLPHGYEGQGAEHSSARLERFPPWRPRTTSRSPTPRPPPSTSTCCAARCGATCASRW